jgi:hypothetical protein
MGCNCADATLPAINHAIAENPRILPVIRLKNPTFRQRNCAMSLLQETTHGEGGRRVPQRAADILQEDVAGAMTSFVRLRSRRW